MYATGFNFDVEGMAEEMCGVLISKVSDAIPAGAMKGATLEQRVYMVATVVDAVAAKMAERSADVQHMAELLVGLTTYEQESTVDPFGYLL